jgi:hypothetical protein
LLEMGEILIVIGNNKNLSKVSDDK